jgi:hypothetical protein
MGWVKKAAYITAGFYALAWLYKGAQVSLSYLKQTDFRQWWPAMNTELVALVDELGRRVDEAGGELRISPADGALGRKLGPNDDSQHNVTKWGEVRAADVMITGIDLQDAYDLAREVGFTGVGVYPDWDPDPGLHVDVREDASPDDPAQWAGLDTENGGQTYVAASQVVRTV